MTSFSPMMPPPPPPSSEQKHCLKMQVRIVLIFFKQDVVHILAMYLQKVPLKLIRLNPSDDGLGSKLVTFIWGQRGSLICFAEV